MSATLQVRDWSKAALGDILNIETGKLDSNYAEEAGTYPFFTCAPSPLRIGTYAFDCDALLLAGNNANGVFHLNRYKGKFNAYQRTYVLTLKESYCADLGFLYYRLATLGQLLTDYSQGTATKFLTMKILNPLEILLPPLPEQKAIAHILGTLDDKIEVNRRMNEALEGMARALFKSWFVDFDPVLDNALAAGNPIPEEFRDRAAQRADAAASAASQGRRSLPNPLAAQFPNAFHDSDLGPIPQGWEVKALSECIDLIGGGTPKTSIDEYWDGDIPWFSVVDAPTDSDVFVIDTEKRITQRGLQNSSAKLLPQGTTIISARGTVGKCALMGVPMTTNQSCYAIRGSGNFTDSFVYFTIRWNVADLQRQGHGSVFNTITRSTFDGIRIPAPASGEPDCFDKQTGPLLNRILTNLRESRTLAALRDTLLPKLLSGELRVNDAEKFVETAV